MPAEAGNAGRPDKPVWSSAEVRRTSTGIMVSPTLTNGRMAVSLSTGEGNKREKTGTGAAVFSWPGQAAAVQKPARTIIKIKIELKTRNFFREKRFMRYLRILAKKDRAG